MTSLFWFSSTLSCLFTRVSLSAWLLGALLKTYGLIRLKFEYSLKWFTEQVIKLCGCPASPSGSMYFCFILIHLGRDKMAAISQTTLPNASSWIEIFEFRLKCNWNITVNIISALVQIMAWHRPGDKPLSEPMIVSLLTHICFTRPQWVNNLKSMKKKDAIQALYAWQLLPCRLLLPDASPRALVQVPNQQQDKPGNTLFRQWGQTLTGLTESRSAHVSGNWYKHLIHCMNVKCA